MMMMMMIMMVMMMMMVVMVMMMVMHFNLFIFRCRLGRWVKMLKCNVETI